jgi:hypothetical protein
MAVMADQGVGRGTTPRDLALLRFVGEQYGVPLSVFGELVARYSPGVVRPESQATLARRHALRLEQLGFAGRRTMLGHRWVFLTREGMREAGLPFQPGEIPLWKLEHTATVARLRLHLEAEHRDWRWESERWIRRRYRQEHLRGRIPDGLLEVTPDHRIAIEVELTRKGVHRYPELFEALESWHETWWYVRDEREAAWLEERMREAVRPIKPWHRVFVLPEGVAGL